jgi:hypothetical protein
MNIDNSHLFERLYTKAFKTFLSEVCLEENELEQLKSNTGDLIDKETGKTFYDLGKLIIEINLDINNNTIDLEKFKFAKHKFMKSSGFQKAVLSYYQQKNYIAIVKPSSPQSMMAKIILYYKPKKQPSLTDIIKTIDRTNFLINTDNCTNDNIKKSLDMLSEVSTDYDETSQIDSDFEYESPSNL